MSEGRCLRAGQGRLNWPGPAHGSHELLREASVSLGTAELPEVL